MKYKLRYHRNYTVTLMTESKTRKLETWTTMATLMAIAIAAFALVASPEPRAIVETDSVIAPAMSGLAGSGIGS